MRPGLNTLGLAAALYLTVTRVFSRSLTRMR
jgi:hypothetical protein